MKALTLITSFVLLPFFAQTQTSSWSFGNVAGPTFTGLQIEDGSTDWENTISFAVGGYVRAGMSPRMSFVSGLLFETRGAKVEEDITNLMGIKYGERLRKTKINELVIPVLFQYGGGDKVYVYATAGPYIGFMVSAIGKVSSEVSSSNYVEDISNEFTRFDAGICAGGGVILALGENLEAGAEFRFSQGLNDRQNWSGADRHVTTNSTALLLSVGYRISR